MTKDEKTVSVTVELTEDEARAVSDSVWAPIKTGSMKDARALQAWAKMRECIAAQHPPEPEVPDAPWLVGEMGGEVAPARQAEAHEPPGAQIPPRLHRPRAGDREAREGGGPRNPARHPRRRSLRDHERGDGHPRDRRDAVPPRPPGRSNVKTAPPRECVHPHHFPPMHLYVPPGKTYRHRCPRCGRTAEIHGRRTRP